MSSLHLQPCGPPSSVSVKKKKIHKPEQRLLHEGCHHKQTYKEGFYFFEIQEASAHVVEFVHHLGLLQREAVYAGLQFDDLLSTRREQQHTRNVNHSPFDMMKQ